MIWRKSISKNIYYAVFHQSSYQNTNGPINLSLGHSHHVTIIFRQKRLQNERSFWPLFLLIKLQSVPHGLAVNFTLINLKKSWTSNWDSSILYNPVCGCFNQFPLSYIYNFLWKAIARFDNVLFEILGTYGVFVFSCSINLFNRTI